MKRLLVIFICLIGFNCLAEKLDSKIVDNLANAIYKLEGGSKTKYPYGIKSLPIKGSNKVNRESYARNICKNTITNNYDRWQKAGRPGKFLVFLGSKYCPPSADRKGHKNWINNITKISGHDF